MSGVQRFDTLPDRYTALELVPYFDGRLVLAKCERYLSDKAREKGAVNLGEYGEVEVEWVRGRRSLTLYLSASSEFMLDCGEQLPFEPEMLPGLFAALCSFIDTDQADHTAALAAKDAEIERLEKAHDDLAAFLRASWNSAHRQHDIAESHGLQREYDGRIAATERIAERAGVLLAPRADGGEG